MEKSNYIIKRYSSLRQYGFTEEKLGQVLEISPRLLNKAERYLGWEDRLMIFYLNGNMPLYMLLGYIIYSCLWIVTLIVTAVLNHCFEIILIEGIIWIDLIWIYAVLTIAIIFAGNKGYFYCRKARVELCKIIKKLVDINRWQGAIK